jgi:photosystem II stability/assembly factor-like uncharacterized protein
MKLAVGLVAALAMAGNAGAQSWIPQQSGTTASLRGVCAVSAKLVWASGTGGAWLRTVDGGATWTHGAVPGAEKLDFRGIHAIDANTAWVMSIGPDSASRIYHTGNGGVHWTLQFTAADPKGFFDALAFWDGTRGMIVGDPVGGRFEIFTTADGGATWSARQGPPAGNQEGAFAASNSSLVVRGKSEAWFATGGPGGARVFHTTDAGGSWTASATPIRNDNASSGIFSLAFAGGAEGIAVGGDYTKPASSERNIAITHDDGRVWSIPPSAPAGYRSAVVHLPGTRTWIVTGTSGSDISEDAGHTWRTFDQGDYNALSFASADAGWAVGPKGKIARFSSSPTR